MPNSSGGPCAPHSPPCPSRLCQRGTGGGRGAWRQVRCSQCPGRAVAAQGGVVGTTSPRGDLTEGQKHRSGIRWGQGGPCPKGTSQPPPAADRQGTTPHPSETRLGHVGQEDASRDSRVPAQPRRGRCHRQGPVLSGGGKGLHLLPPARPHSPPRGSHCHPGVGGSPPARRQRPLKPPSSHPVKPVRNWGGATASCSGRSAAKPDPTVPTPKRQGKARPLLGRTPTLSCRVFRAPRDTHASVAPQGPPQGRGKQPFIPPHTWPVWDGHPPGA